MNIILFSQNAHKIDEIKAIFKYQNIEPYTKYLASFDVNENGNTFAENALLKLQALQKNIQSIKPSLLQDSILMAEDSGICVEALDNQPGIHSARFANLHSKNTTKNATDKSNNAYLINMLKQKNLKSSQAHFVSCVTCYIKCKYLYAYGFLYGSVITKESGKNGFGYDTLFIPQGFNKTLADLDIECKNRLSHRSQALKLMKILLK